jgi:amino acid transporter
MTNGKQAMESNEGSRRVLTLFDCVCIIIGTIIGAGIFRFPSVVASHLPSLPWFLAAWILGGVIAMIGALCFAELTTTYPDAGGDYGYLKRAFHPHLGFAFSWTAFWVIRPGNIGALAMIFGEFSVKFLEQLNRELSTVCPLTMAVLIVIVITALNFLGVVFSKTAQNALTTAKVLGILIVLGGALSLAESKPDGGATAMQTSPANSNDQIGESKLTAPQDLRNAEVDDALSKSTDKNNDKSEIQWGSFWLAMVFVMFTFGGWNDIAFVAGEVKEPSKNLLRSLVLGTLGVLAIYLLVNLALLWGLGMSELAELGSRWDNPTAIFVERSIGSTGAALFSALVCISCLGGINAMIFTSPRIYWATSQDYPGLAVLTGSMLDRRGWWRAIALQCLVTLLFIVVFGRIEGGIDKMVAATAPYFWLFLGLTVVSLMVNRQKYAGQFQGFRVPLYPLTPIVFLTACFLMMLQAWSYLIEKGHGWIGLFIGGLVLVGVVLSLVMRRTSAT